MITFVTAWYVLKNKFNEELYRTWIDNLLSNVVHFKLVVYTNTASFGMVEKYTNNSNIKIILREISEFKCYAYRDMWIKNHSYNPLMNRIVGWESDTSISLFSEIGAFDIGYISLLSLFGTRINLDVYKLYAGCFFVVHLYQLRQQYKLRQNKSTHNITVVSGDIAF